jgi:hypothetical protein
MSFANNSNDSQNVVPAPIPMMQEQSLFAVLGDLTGAVNGLTAEVKAQKAIVESLQMEVKSQTAIAERLRQEMGVQNEAIKRLENSVESIHATIVPPAAVRAGTKRKCVQEHGPVPPPHTFYNVRFCFP